MSKTDSDDQELQRYRRLFAKLEEYFKASNQNGIAFGWNDEENDWLAFTLNGCAPDHEFHATQDIPAVLEKAMGLDVCS